MTLEHAEVTQVLAFKYVGSGGNAVELVVTLTANKVTLKSSFPLNSSYIVITKSFETKAAVQTLSVPFCVVLQPS